MFPIFMMSSWGAKAINMFFFFRFKLNCASLAFTIILNLLSKLLDFEIGDVDFLINIEKIIK